MTRRLYENDSYITEFTATVLSCTAAEILEETNAGGAEATCDDAKAAVDSAEAADNGDAAYYWVALDQTAFFPEGGGQNPDTGRLDEHPVVDVQIKGDTVWHKTTLLAEPGQIVAGCIDWEKRFSNMQQHSGEHIFSGLVHRHFGYNNVGFHLGSSVVTMDFSGPLTATDIDRIEWEVNDAIIKNVPITVAYPDKEALATMEYRSKIDIEGQVRLVTVEGYDVCACCAPHVARTGEIGGLKVVDSQKYKGGTRVSILCGFRMLRDYRQKQALVTEISRSLSAPVEKVDAAVRRQLDENARLRQVIYEMQEQMILEDIEAIEPGRENVWFFKEEMDAAAMRRTMNRALEKVSGCCGVFCGSDDDGYKYIIGSKSRDARELAGVLKSAVGARGGGSAQMIQGFAGVSRDKLETVLPE